MAEYKLQIKVNQIVTKDIEVSVLARNEEQAVQKAREVLEVYPKPHEVRGVPMVRTTKAEYWIPRDIEVVNIIKEGDDQVA